MERRALAEIELPRQLSAASQARKWLGGRYGAELETDKLDTAKLLASELVNNAVLHGQGTITLRAALDKNRLLVEVIDQGSGFERVLDQNEFEKIGGRGLEIVETAASRWGVHQGTTHVWFELERAGPRIGIESRPERDAD
jgi:anti-sigma regulatory factor (Ser/Thr protein kinase)